MFVSPRTEVDTVNNILLSDFDLRIGPMPTVFFQFKYRVYVASFFFIITVGSSPRCA